MEQRAGQRILIVDDNVDSAVTLGVLLRLKGHDIRVAHDGETALKIASTFKPKLALIDLRMPIMNAFELSRQLRLMSECKNTLIVALTASGTTEDRERAFQSGCDAVLLKPIEVHVLETLLQE